MPPGIFLLDGPSGSGKSTLVRMLLENCPELVFCPRVTTRAPRAVEGPDYRFVSMEEFDRLDTGGSLAVSRRFEFGMAYGLPRDKVEQARAQGRPVLALIDLGTIEQARAVWPDLTGIFLISPPSDLRKRLLQRGDLTPEQIEERLGNAEAALKFAVLYDYVVVNREGALDRSLEQLRWIVRQS